MLLRYLSIFLLATSVTATHPLVEQLRELKRRQDANTTVDGAAQMSSWISALGLTGSATFATAIPTCVGGYNPPPASLYGMILTAVPGSVLANLSNPRARSSIASEMKAGNTPSWYNAMPTEIKSYISSIQASTPTGCSATITGAAGATGGAGVFGENGVVGTASSSALAARATAAVAAGLSGVLGFVGLMIIL